MHSLWQKIADILLLTRLEKRWQKVAAYLAIIVVFCTTYMLILPAITMENETYCGIEEHSHNENCYAFQNLLFCDNEEESHEHTEACYIREQILTCNIKEHIHQDSCLFPKKAENEQIQKIYKDESVTVKATYPPSAGIDNNAEFVVKKIDPGTSNNEYNSCYSEAINTIEKTSGQTTDKKITDFQLYDISFILDGEEIQPLDKVDIQISFPSHQLTETSDVSVIHYAKDGVQMPDVQDYEVDKSGNLNTSFKTESFSLFAVVTTESELKNIVTLTKYNVTSTTLTTSNTYAITSGSYALYANSDATLSSVEIATRESDKITGDQSIAQWTFTRSSGSNYYISTTINNTTYYLRLSGSTLSLTSTQSSRTAFTVTRSSSNLTLRSGNSSYINISANGASVGSSSVLSLYTLPTGSFTVQFDGRLGYPQYMSSSNRKYTGAENVQKTTDSQGYVTLPTPEETKTPGNYPMRLNGWYDIINKVYYDSSMFGQKIKVTNNTVFYAEWIPETYDIGQNVNVVKDQPDTSSFITTTVYDYNELFNMHSATYSESSGTWTFDPDSELGFIFFDYLTEGNIANISNKNVAVDGITVNAEKTNGRRGSSTNFPGTITLGIANEARINALFGPDPIPGRIVPGEADWLYSFDEESGYYYYNSAKNAAAYNQSEQRFYVYENVVNIDSQNSLNDFLPFNYGKAQFAEKDNEANYWFGMKSEINFYLPEDSGSGYNKAANGKDDMQFRFSGDDDVWIFIDGQLALDLGGVHDVVYGEINFSTGNVKTGQAISSSQVADNTAEGYDGMPGVSGTTGITTTNLPMTLKGGQEHTITVYYLERGSSLSNCAIYFNLSPAYELEILKQDKEKNEKLAGAKFQIFDDEACTQPSTVYVQNASGVKEEIPNAILTIDENGLASCWGLLSGKTYFIKEIEPPPGYPLITDTIQINLTAGAQSTFVAIDSNGNKWEFADAHIVSEGDVYRIELNVFNDLYIGGEKELYVEKSWAEGSENIPDEITVQLYANGEETTRSLTLNQDNNWSGYFYSLPENDADGNEIVYTVKENQVIGFSPSYEEIEGGDTQVTALEDGGIYRFVIPSYNGWAVGLSSSYTVVPAVVSEADDSQLWVAKKSGNYFLLQNKAYTNRYLSISTSTNGITATTSTTSTSALITLNSSGRLYSSAGGYLRAGTKTSINGSGNNFRGTRTASYAATISAYEQNDRSGWLVTNTPWEKLSIPVVKHWDRNIPEADRTNVNLSLYLVTDGRAEEKDTLILNKENGWKGNFSDLPYPTDGSYYCITENTDEFSVFYSGKTVFVYIDKANREAALVEFDEDGKATEIEITNYSLVLLPETGGSGNDIYIIGGLLMGLGAVFLLCYIKHRERRRKCS